MLHSATEPLRLLTVPPPTAALKQHLNRGQARVADDDNTRFITQMQAIADRQDEAAFAALFAHFAPRIKGFLMKSGATAAQAEDCAQDVMATVWRKAAMFDPTRANVSTWIFTIARNRRIDLLRRDRRPEPEDLPWGPEPERDQVDAMVLQQETDRLGQAMEAELPKSALAPTSNRDAIMTLVEDMAFAMGEDVFIAQSRALQRRRDQQKTLRHPHRHPRCFCRGF